VRIPRIPILILIISFLYSFVIGVDASVGTFFFVIIVYKPVIFVVNLVVKWLRKIIPKLKGLIPKRNFIREIDESGEYW